MRQKLRLLFIPVLLGMMMVLQSFSVNHTEPTINNETYKLIVNLDGEDFNSLSEKFYRQINADSTNLNLEVFKKAMKGYLVMRNEGRIENDRYLTVVDYSLSSREKRLWVIDLYEKALIFNELTAHGKNSGGEYATSFSNVYNSKKSNLGFLVTGETYNGRHQLSLKLHGIENGFNTNAYNRGIVIHGAYYVDERYVEREEALGRSFGCPAVPTNVNPKLVKKIRGGSCVFLYYPSQRYLQQSSVLNSDTYIPIEQLKELIE